ncbi:MAG: ABC transporter substrate-binding protein, partial [Bifidobacteriaceae bacterium]|nr:ABC transporter substrate-binding protein [Bifidobacteriaceae bacterium]
MTTSTKRRCWLALVAASSLLTLGLTSCGSEKPQAKTPSSPASSSTPTSVEIEDNHGTYTIKLPPQSVVATDNRLFQTLADWNVELAAAPVDLISADNPYKTNPNIVNLGAHREPNLEALVAVNPDLVINGQRFASFYEDIKTLVPEATVIELDPREDQPFDQELKRQVEILGQIFNRQTEAKKLVDDFDASIARVKKSYQPEVKVMALITSGGEINYSAPGSGRTLGPVFEILGLTPAIEVDGSSDHQGDDISVEAIAQSNPGLILVMDRDAAVGQGSEGEPYTPANQLIANSQA